MGFSESDASTLVDLIRKIVQQEIANIPNLERSYFGKVVRENSDGTYEVQIQGINGTYSKMLNKSQERLSAGDTIVVKAINNNFSNAYIAVKCGR